MAHSTACHVKDDKMFGVSFPGSSRTPLYSRSAAAFEEALAFASLETAVDSCCAMLLSSRIIRSSAVTVSDSSTEGLRMYCSASMKSSTS